jgi:putative effector of murein hydrolase
MLLNDVPPEQRLAYLLPLHINRYKVRSPWKSVRMIIVVGCMIGLAYFWAVMKEQGVSTPLTSSPVSQSSNK